MTRALHPAATHDDPFLPASKNIHLLPWQVTGIGTPTRPSGAKYQDPHYCSSTVADVATLAFQFTGPLSGPNASQPLGCKRGD